MSKEYPCVYYYDNGMCKKFEEPGYTVWCVLGPCSHETPSNADHIRGMTDEELADLLEGERGNMLPGNALSWLQQPYKEDDHG